MAVFGIAEGFDVVFCGLPALAATEGSFDTGRTDDEDAAPCTAADVVGPFFLISNADIWRVKDVTDDIRACR